MFSLFVCIVVVALILFCSRLPIASTEGFASNLEPTHESDYLPSGKYRLYRMTDRIVLEGRVSYLSNSIMEYSNKLHETKTKYIFDGSKDGGSYTSVDDDEKVIVFNKSEWLLTVKNDGQTEEYTVVTIERDHNDIQFMHNRDVQENPMIQKKEWEKLHRDYFIGFLEKDKWLLTLSEKEENLLREAFPIKRSEESRTRRLNIPTQEIYYFADFDTIQLYMKSLVPEDRQSVFSIINQLNPK